MTTIIVPYHQDERLPHDSLPVPAGPDVATVEDVALPDGDIWQRLAALYEVTADTVRAGATAGAVPAVVSGDCLVAMATLVGVQRTGVAPAVVWFDAHGDVHTLHTSTSGYLGGLALRLLVGVHPELLADHLGLQPVTAGRAVLVDARDLDPAEVDYLASGEVRRYAVEDVTADVLPDGPILLHIDVDVFDAGDVPGLRIPAPGGPARADVLVALRRVVATGRVVALDIACPWNRAADDHEQQVRTELLAHLLALR